MTNANSSSKTFKTTPSCSILIFVAFLPIATALLLYRIDNFNPAPLPDSCLSWEHVSVHNHNAHALDQTERIGAGILPGPEDIAYDAEEHVVYTSCNDGWIKRVTVTELVGDVTVQNWAYVGGRPLGIVLTSDKELIVAESDKGLLKVTRDKDVKLLTAEAEGLKFRLTDGVDVAKNGIIYFTDASSKYNLEQHMFDILEGRPYGRFMSYDPSTNRTQVLVRDLYFANGVAVSPNQDYVIFCETPLRRCQKYHIEGENKGKVDMFVDNLPGYPDNIRYDGEDTYYIALASGKTFSWDVLMRYTWVRKTVGILSRYVKFPYMLSHSGVVAVNLKGEMIALYTDQALALITVGIKIENHMYYGALDVSYIRRINLTEKYNVADM
ncbi:hypothetical protein GIB67_030061 [Kingdonia uniflora]|uniref:Strictosidine synthase conserved region domain-containing protein n=1 Tax=Kingdonia uniflora TaxID=39325 RepID=A0A7J7MY30_9MAGN|nr:hypothetical protein GIB67_030061 [Kingdonia uniflora]